jgi:hypothetical protein
MLSIRNLLLVLLQGTVCHDLHDLQNSHRSLDAISSISAAILSSFSNVSLSTSWSSSACQSLVLLSSASAERLEAVAPRQLVPPSTFVAVADAWPLFLEHSCNCFLSLSCQRDPLNISACRSVSRFLAMASKFSDSILIANFSGSVAVVCIDMVVVCCLLIHLL